MNNKEKFLINLLTKNLNSKKIIMTSDLNSFIKWDSLQKIRIILEMEKKYKKKFPQNKLEFVNKPIDIIKNLN